MLIVSRREGERIMIGDDIVVEVKDIGGGMVRLGVHAPRSTPVYREELWEAIKAENEAAASTDLSSLPQPSPQLQP